MADDAGSEAGPKANEEVVPGADSSEKSTDPKSEVKRDEDLDDLLDSALKDFDNQPGATASAGAAEAASSSSTDAAAKGNGELGSEDPGVDQFTEEFSDELAAQFEEAMRNFMSQDPAVVEQMQRLSNAASNAGDSVQAQQEFATALGQTLASMCQNAQGLQEDVPEEDMARVLGGAMPGDGGEGADFMPLMQGMMKTLLSKEVLYPSLKDISDKYPPWLEENKATTDAEQFAKYEKQLTLMKKICSEYESETPTDSEEVKTQRFEAVMDHMQQMQELGQPPKDIIGEMAPGLEFDENGMPRLPGMGAQCAVM